MTKLEFYRELENIIEVPPGTLRGEEVLRDLEGWNSLAVVAFIVMADAELSATVNIDGLANCKTVSDLARLFPGKIAD